MEGLTTAPLAPGDGPAVARVWRACEIHDDGAALFTEEDFAASCRRPSMDLRRDSIGVWDGGELVALALLHGERDVFAGVLPSQRRRGIGTWLMRWTQDAARAARRRQTCQSLSGNAHDARALLEADGYERRWEGWIFDIELRQEPEPPSPPAGYAVREFVRARDERAVYRVVETAFGEWPDADRWNFEEWAAETFERPAFAPEHVGTVVRGDDVVGASVLIQEGELLWVAQLAVARQHRGRGLARALLAHAFLVAWRAGLRHVGLSTDSRTGARGLYERVGMRVTRTSWEYAKLLR
jgi:mycothiol synthase